jgi:hypothetical protein
MSGTNRVFSKTDESIFLAAENAAALSRTPDNALSAIVKAGIEAWEMENDMAILSVIFDQRTTAARIYRCRTFYPLLTPDRLNPLLQLQTPYELCAHTLFSAICIAAIVIFWINRWFLSLVHQEYRSV